MDGRPGLPGPAPTSGARVPAREFSMPINAEDSTPSDSCQRAAESPHFGACNFPHLASASLAGEAPCNSIVEVERAPSDLVASAVDDALTTGPSTAAGRQDFWRCVGSRRL